MFETACVRDPALDLLQRHGINALEFVFTEGERFLVELQKKPNGGELLQLVLRQPPMDSIQIIDPYFFRSRTRRRDFALSQLLDKLSRTWSESQYASLETGMLEKMKRSWHSASF